MPERASMSRHKEDRHSSWGEFSRILALTFLSVILAVFLAEAYRYAGYLNLGPWQGALVVHGAASVAVVAGFFHRNILRENFCFLGSAAEAPRWYGERPWLAYVPAVVLLGGSSILVLLSRIWGGYEVRESLSMPWAWIFCVPVFEEIFFRGGIGVWYRRQLPGLSGRWLAATTFALAHAKPNFTDLMQGHVGFPLGPFLLGLVCEGVYSMSGSLIPAMVLHASANATVMIFELGDERWLNWLTLLYI